MATPRKSRVVKLSELAIGQFGDCFAQLFDKRPGTTRDNKPFFSCRFRDAQRTVTVMVWADGGFFEECQRSWQVGGFYKLRGTLASHGKFGSQIEPEMIRPVTDDDREDGFSELDFLERSRFEPDQMLAELDALAAAEIADVPLRNLVQAILTAHADKLRLLPGSERRYYPYAGGWLEHTLNVTRTCCFLADHYRAQFPDLAPPLNRDLIVAGAILHDIGRVKELESPVPGLPPRAGITGELFGHLFLANDLIRDAARDIADLNPEALDLLLHIVINHQRLPEWGSPRLPCIPEVLILHHADDLDAKFEMYARCLAKDMSEGPFTERDPNLGRALLKRRGV